MGRLAQQQFPSGHGSHATPSEIAVTQWAYPDAIKSGQLRAADRAVRPDPRGAPTSAPATPTAAWAPTPAWPRPRRAASWSSWPCRADRGGGGVRARSAVITAVPGSRQRRGGGIREAWRGDERGAVIPLSATVRKLHRHSAPLPRARFQGRSAQAATSPALHPHRPGRERLPAQGPATHAVRCGTGRRGSCTGSGRSRGSGSGRAPAPAAGRRAGSGRRSRRARRPRRTTKPEEQRLALAEHEALRARVGHVGERAEAGARRGGWAGLSLKQARPA